MLDVKRKQMKWVQLLWQTAPSSGARRGLPSMVLSARVSTEDVWVQQEFHAEVEMLLLPLGGRSFLGKVCENFAPTVKNVVAMY